MATADPISGIDPALASASTELLVMVAEMPAPQQENLFASLAAIFPAKGLLIATPNEPASQKGLRVVPAQARNSAASSALPPTAVEFVAAYQLAQDSGARAILMLGPESDSLQPEALSALATAVLGPSDLASPRYELPSQAGLVNSAIFYPLTRALFASCVHFPLAIDLGLSLRMAERLAQTGQRAALHADAILWPVNEAMAAGFVIDEIDVGPRTLPRPAEAEVNALITQLTGSLFGDIEAKAAFWQRPRKPPLARARSEETQTAAAEASDIGPMIEAFRYAYANLHEIWSLVLPPNSLLGLKRLWMMDPATFHMPESLWARIIYDFAVAYRLRTMNRGHLLGALIPLYMAWAASHLNVISSGATAEHHIEAVAAAFEEEKPYMVSRWRWPDRFNS